MNLTAGRLGARAVPVSWMGNRGPESQGWEMTEREFSLTPKPSSQFAEGLQAPLSPLSPIALVLVVSPSGLCSDPDCLCP